MRDHRETFISSGALSNDASSSGASSSFSFSTGATGGFEGVATSSAMTKFSSTSTKKSKGSQTNLALAFEGGLTFIQEIRVGGRLGSDNGIL